MLNPLINPLKTQENDTKIDTSKLVNITAVECAKAFVDSLETEKRARFKRMVELGVKVGKSVAMVYNVDEKEFLQAVKELI